MLFGLAINKDNSLMLVMVKFFPTISCHFHSLILLYVYFIFFISLGFLGAICEMTLKFSRFYSDRPTT
jgi:hypothetical protein